SSDSKGPADKRLVRLDLTTGAQAQPVYLGGDVSHLAHVEDRLIASVQHVSGLAEVVVLEWRSGAVLARHWFDPAVAQTVLRGTGGSVWSADHEGGKIVRLDPRSLLPVGEPISVGTKPTWLVAAAGSLFVTDQDDGTVVRIDVHSGKKVGLPIRIAPPTRDAPAPSVAPAGQSVWVSSFASNTLNHIASTAGRGGGKVTVRIAGMNDRHQGDPVTNGGLAGIGHFTASGAISEKGKAVVYRTKIGPLITLRYVTSGSKGTITFVVKIDIDARTS